MSYHNFEYDNTSKLYDMFENSPLKYFELLKTMDIRELYNHLNDYEHNYNDYHGNNALHCLCMIMSKKKISTSPNNNYGINTNCTLELGLNILDFMVKYGANLYHRDYYNDTPLDYVNDSFKDTANWKLDTEFVSRLRNIYNHFHIKEYPATYNNQLGDIRYKYSDRFYEIIELDNITKDTENKIIDILLQKNISYNDNIYNIINAIDNIKLEYETNKKVVNPIL